MENLENELKEIGTLLRFGIRYMDDVLAIIKRVKTGTIFEKLNLTHRTIVLIMKIEKDPQGNDKHPGFLDAQDARE